MTKKRPGINSLNLPSPVGVAGITSCLEAIDKTPSFRKEKNFESRAEVIDLIEFHIIDQLDGLLGTTNQPGELIILKYRAEKLMCQLEEINNQLFKNLRKNLRNKEYTGNGFRNLVNEYVDLDSGHNGVHEEAGYDNLDIFINGLFPLEAIPEQNIELEPEMVFYQKTPARIVFELVEKAHFTNDDVFFDLGSGMGQVAILVNLLSGIPAIGVEYEPAFCSYARLCAEGLDLPNVTFINADARKADYSKGTVFFMYTPFEGNIMQEVLAVLQKEARSGKIKIFTYGPCTAQVALQPWLDFAAPKNDGIYKLGVFSSR